MTFNGYGWRLVELTKNWRQPIHLHHNSNFGESTADRVNLEGGFAVRPEALPVA